MDQNVLPQKAFDELKEIYQKVYGVTLSDEEVRRFGTDFLEILYLLLKKSKQRVYNVSASKSNLKLEKSEEISDRATL